MDKARITYVKCTARRYAGLDDGLYQDLISEALHSLWGTEVKYADLNSVGHLESLYKQSMRWAIKRTFRQRGALKRAQGVCDGVDYGSYRDIGRLLDAIKVYNRCTAREQHILDLVEDGYSYSEIGCRLHISKQRIHQIIKGISQKGE